MTYLIARLERAARCTAGAFFQALYHSLATRFDYESGDFLDSTTGGGPTGRDFVRPSRDEHRDDGMPLPYGVPVHDAIVEILTEIGSQHDGYRVVRSAIGLEIYCSCGERLIYGGDSSDGHRAHVAEIQASAIVMGIQAMLSPRLRQPNS